MAYIRRETISGSQIERICKKPKIRIEIKCEKDNDKSILREVARKFSRNIGRLTGERVAYSVKAF